MSKRNFTLLIIILIVIVLLIFGFLYLTNTNSSNGTTTGTNFLSRFNPFATTKIIPKPTPPTNVSGYIPPINTEIPPKVKLVKVSTMPIAGFTLFKKERLKDVTIPVTTTPNTDTNTISITPATQTPDTTSPSKTTPTTKNTKAKVVVKPVAPATEFMTTARYIEKAKGIIYETFADKIEERKFSNPTIPKIHDAYFGNNGESILMRHLKPDEETIETFIGSLPKEYLGADTTGNNTVKGLFLPDNIKDISVSTDTYKVFYLFEKEDNIIGTILDLKSNQKTQIFDSPFTEWLSSFGGNKEITLSTKPSATTPGFTYEINTDKKELNKVIGGINGLTTLISPNGKLILYAGSNLSLNIYHTDTRNVDTTTLNTLPEKCSWNKNSDAIYCAVPRTINAGIYPDSWYKGETSFSDQIWKMDLKTGNTTLLVDPVLVQNGEDVDGIKLAVDDGENYLFFVNKKDSFLWKLDLK